MSWATLSDMALKASIGTFKTMVTYTRAAAPGSPVSIAAVFEKSGYDVDPETGALVNTEQPSVGIRLADLPAMPDAGDTVTVNGEVYQVLDVQRDKEGGAKLPLGRRSV